MRLILDMAPVDIIAHGVYLLCVEPLPLLDIETFEPLVSGVFTLSTTASNRLQSGDAHAYRLV